MKNVDIIFENEEADEGKEKGNSCEHVSFLHH